MNNRILSYKISKIDYCEPTSFFLQLDRDFKPSILTGEGRDDISKQSVIGIKPARDVTITDLDSFWQRVEELNNSTDFHTYPYPINRIGAIGYISYEALHSIENIKKQTTDLIKFPYFNWTLYKEYYYFDNSNRELFKISISYHDEDNFSGESFKDTDFKVENLTPDFSKSEYIKNVEKIQEYILDGEVYEVNLTQGIIGDFVGSPLALFKKLYYQNSAPYSAYLERDGYTIISNSPELYLNVENRLVESRPIKGTIKRSDNLQEDMELQKKLYNSSKNQAELYMIVDLLRNDLSKVCKVGSVQVVNKKRVEHYKSVHHLVSIINGVLEDNCSIVDLIKATFPGGSITGCPKIRCMEITEELEKSSRNLYTGTLFIMNKEYLNSNIVIRSAVIKDNKIVFNSGGAVTIDSDPTDEYLEFLVKLKSIFKAVNCEDYIQ